MKNKLLTTALVSSMIGVVAHSATAQTTVSGNLELTYMAHSSKQASTGINSFRGFGKESQINIANKGKLNNGMDYAAGFSFEFDGPDASATNTHSENVYIDLISGNTTFTIGADHIQNPDANVTNIAGFGYLRYDGSFGTNPVTTTSSRTGLYIAGANSPYSAYGVGVMQKTPIGTFSYYYAPTNNTNSGALNDIHNSASASVGEPAGSARGSDESSMEIGFRGDLGVKGLTVLAFANKADQKDAITGGDEKGRRFAAVYTTGPFTIAGDYAKTEGTTTGETATAFQTGEEVKARSLGLGYAITPNLSASITRGKAETNVTARNKEETTDMIAIGYNLGAVTTTLQFKQVDNHAGNAGADAEAVQFRIGTRF